MCLAIPLRILSIDPVRCIGVVDTGGGSLTIDLSLTPDALVGGHVLVHAGAAIEALAEEDAQAILATFAEFAQLDALLAPRDATSE